MSHTTIVIPTFKRPDFLANCLNSCRSLKSPLNGGTWDVVVVDNSPDGDARMQVARMIGESPFALRYVHEPRPGISAARNCGISQCTGEFLAFLDDDETAREDWLIELHQAREKYNGVAVFGQVNVQVPRGAEWASEMLAHSFGRVLECDAGEIPKKLVNKLGSGNSLFALSALNGANTFSDEFALSGGEDTAVIQKVMRDGGRLVWAPAAQVNEFVGAERAKLGVLLERRFSSGQLRAHSEIKAGVPIITPAVMMLLGAGQAAVGSGRSVLKVLTRQDPRASLCEVAAGLGKVFWLPGMRLDRYKRSKKK